MIWNAPILDRLWKKLNRRMPLADFLPAYAAYDARFAALNTGGTAASSRVCME